MSGESDHDDHMTFPEINRELRGHIFYPTPEERAAIPDLYATEESSFENKIVHARYSTRGGVGEWWLMELEHASDDTQMLAFGFADLGHREAGYFDLVALESLLIERPFGEPPIIIERDLDWTPRPWSEVVSDRP